MPEKVHLPREDEAESARAVPADRERPLRLLLIEDSEEDTLLIIRQLVRAGWDPRFTRVQTREALQAALAEGAWDLLLCDYTLPRFDALAALPLVKEMAPDLPVIIVSGTIGESTAVALMKAGAHDYVSKDHLPRLAPVVERALREARVRLAQGQLETRLRESEERFRLAFENANIGMNLISPERIILRVNQRLCDILGYTREEIEGRNVNDITHPEDRTIGMDFVGEAVRGGPERTAFEKRYVHRDGHTVWGEVTSSLVRDAQGVPRYFISHLQDITERRQSVERLRKALGATVRAISTLVETRDPYTAGHQRRVAGLARALAAVMALPEERIEGLRIASTIHDIGKISIPAEILSKPMKLSPIEYSLIKTHPRAGQAILENVDFPWPVARIILEHHERLDGSGYPEGVKGEATLLESRILQVADVVESMASHRPYRPALGIEAALEEIDRGKGILYDAAVVNACLTLFRERQFVLEK